jgi:hypothetical protein
MPHYEFSIDEGKTALTPKQYHEQGQEIDPPCCHLHFGWETEEMVDKMVNYYKRSGLISGMRHPREYGGEVQPILDWMVEE